MKSLPEKRIPTKEDELKAIERAGDKWQHYSTRKRNSLIKDEMYHREYHALCDAIMNFRKSEIH